MAASGQASDLMDLLDIQVEEITAHARERLGRS